jgi:hypothetical protein
MEKTLITTVIILAFINIQSIHALTDNMLRDYQSGFNHGVADANTDPHAGQYYIHKPGKGFADHTTAFVDGYIKGWCSISGPGSGIDVNDEPEPTIAAFDCDKGLISATPNPHN